MRMLLISTVAALALAGCANNNPGYPGYGSAYSANACGPGGASLLGALGGAAAGGLLGNQIGGGTGKTVATGAGVLGGGAAGYALGNSLSGC